MGSKSKSNQSSSSQNVNSNQGVNSGVGLNYGVNQSGNFGFNQGASQNTGGSQSSGSSFNQSSQDIWGGQAPYLEDVYGQSQNAFNQSMDQVNALQPGVSQQVQDAYGQAVQGFGNQLGGGFASGLQGQVGPNSYTDAMKGMIAEDAQRMQQQSLGNLDARAAAAGMSGSSGYRDQVGRSMNDINKNAQNAMANIGYQSYNQGIQNQMNLAGMMDQNQQFGTGNLQNMQQGAMNQFNPAMVGQQVVGQYAQNIGGPTTLTQSSGGSQNSSSSFNQGTSNNMGMNTGFSNGMNVGMNQSGGFNNGYGYGASNGQGSSSGWSFNPGSTAQAAAMYMNPAAGAAAGALG